MGTPPGYASAFLLRRALARGKGAEVLYAGDRMWPAIRHGQKVRIAPVDAARLARGDVVATSEGGPPDLLRVATLVGDGVGLAGDADPAPATVVARGSILGRVDLPRRRSPAILRGARRLVIDVREALREGPDAFEDAAATVREKYDAQAPFYVQGSVEPIPEALLALLLRRVAPGGTILVAGSGAGHECFALQGAGYSVQGIDFAAGMVERAQQEAARRGSTVSFTHGDLREHLEPESSLDAVLFTYDVYSFLPGAASRVALLAAMSRWLRPSGIVLLSARLDRSLYDRLVMSLQRRAGRGLDGDACGGGHTRWIREDGSIRRAFVKIFTRRELEAELAASGWRAVEWHAGHIILTRSA